MRRLNMLRCLPGREAALVDRLENAIRSARAEPGCLDYDWFRVEGPADDASTRFFGISRWDGERAFQAHLQGAAFRDFLALERDAPCLAEPPQHLLLVDLAPSR